PQLQALAQTSPTAASIDVRITDSGFEPPSIDVNPGDSVHWTNTSTHTQTVSAVDGLFDSAALAPGAGFSITIAIAGSHSYSSLSNPGFTGTVRFLAPGLQGPATDLANNHIPKLDFPPIDIQDVG